MTHHRILSVSVHDAGARPARGLKGLSFELALGGVDVLAGPNGAGKTTRGPLAITAALEGLATVPTDPRRPYVGALPDGTAVTLEIETPGGVETLTRELDATKGHAFASANQRARDLVGIPPTAWDLRDFAAGTDGDRGKILDAVARAGGAIERWDAARAQEHVRQLLVDKAKDEGRDEADTGALEECVVELPTAPDGATWLRAAETWAAAGQTRTNAAQKESGAVLGRLNATAPEPPRDGDPATDEVTQRDLVLRQATWGRIDQEIAAAKAAHVRHEGEGARLREALVASEAEGRRLKEPLAASELGIPADVEKRVAEAEAAMSAPIPAPSFAGGPSVADAGLAVEAATTRANEARAALTKAQSAHAAISARLTEAQARIKALEGSGGHDQTCRHCHAQDPLGTAASLADARAHAGETALREAEAAQAVAVAREADEEASFSLADASAKLHHAKARAEADASYPERIRAERQRALEGARQVLVVEQRRAKDRAEAHVQAEAQREKALAAARQRWAATRDALAAWQQTQPPAIPTAPSADERLQVAADLAAVEARIGRRRAYADHIERVRSAAAHFEHARATWEATKALVAAVRQARDDVAAAAYTPIHEAARELLARADTAGLPVPYFYGPDDYGAVVPGRGRVPYAGLSESEQRIAAAAIVFALATVAGCPCRLVLLDGLEVVQRDHRAPLLAALALAQREGHVDSVVVTLATTADEALDDLAAIEGVTVHRFAAPEPIASTPPVLALVPPAGEPVTAGDLNCPF